MAHGSNGPLSQHSGGDTRQWQQSPASAAATITTSCPSANPFSPLASLPLTETTFTPLSLHSSNWLSIGSADDGEHEQSRRYHR